MKDAFEKIVERAEKGDVIVLSPGAASFGCFKNEYDKNDQFLREFENFAKN
jgi:UDP-N-acetylmuramoylalanine--D-glutamate ligase